MIDPVSGQKFSDLTYEQKEILYRQRCKSKGTVILLGILLGGLGIHRFYLGHTVHGLIMLIVNVVLGAATAGIWAVAAIPWAIIDAFVAAGGVDRYNHQQAVLLDFIPREKQEV